MNLYLDDDTAERRLVALLTNASHMVVVPASVHLRDSKIITYPGQPAACNPFGVCHAIWDSLILESPLQGLRTHGIAWNAPRDTDRPLR